MEALKLLNEQVLSEQTYAIVEENGEHWTYINGVFMGSEKRNRNGRIYPRNLLEREVNKFQNLIETAQAVGELNHPDSGEINPDRAAILITNLKMEGDFAMGKARILPTECGNTLKNLIRGGVRMGVSSRGTGSLERDNIVAEDYNLITVDAVLMPSCPDAYVNAVTEQTKWVLDEKTNLYIEKKISAEEASKRFNKRIANGGTKAVVDAFREWFKTL